LKCPVTLLIGDQAFLHDLNSLALVRQSKQPVVIVVVNNNGGRIFESLPINEHRQELEPLFVAPHGMTLAKLADGFGIRHAQVRTCREFEQVYTEASLSEDSIVIEALVVPAASREHRTRLLEAVKKELG
jgi:2-succinyl-5-enolpyruvyl-6-hydroxy-3-cyclohexene-1-carboxylate synthase